MAGAALDERTTLSRRRCRTARRLALARVRGRARRRVRRRRRTRRRCAPRSASGGRGARDPARARGRRTPRSRHGPACSSSTADRCWSVRSLVKRAARSTTPTPDEILVTPRRRASAARRWSSTPTDVCSVSGRGDLVRRSSVHRSSDEPRSSTALRAAFAQVVATGRPRHVVVVGEAGIGKTPPRREAIETAHRRRRAPTPHASPTEKGSRSFPYASSRSGRGAVDAAPPSWRSSRAPTRRSRPPAPCSSTSRRRGRWSSSSTTCTGRFRPSSTSSSTSSEPSTGPLLVVSMTRPELLDERPSNGGLTPSAWARCRARTPRPSSSVARARGARADAHQRNPQDVGRCPALPRAALVLRDGR